MMKTPLTLARLRQHITYSWWKYALLIPLVIFGWNLIFTMTAYRPPEDKKVDLYVYGAGNQQATDELLARILQEKYPDMEETSSVFMMVDDTYGPLQMTTYMYAGEGDIYVLPRDEYQNYASQGVFVELENNESLMALCEKYGMDLTRGWRRNSDTGERHLYGIPVDELPGLLPYLYVGQSGCAGVMVNGGNTDNALILLEELIRIGKEEIPEENTAEVSVT